MIEPVSIVCFLYFLRFCSSFSGKLKGFIPQIAAKCKKELAHNCGHNTKVKSGLLQIDPAHRWNFSQLFFEKNQNKKVNTVVHYKKENKPKLRISEKEIQNCLGKVPPQS